MGPPFEIRKRAMSWSDERVEPQRLGRDKRIRQGQARRETGAEGEAQGGGQAHAQTRGAQARRGSRADPRCPGQPCQTDHSGRPTPATTALGQRDRPRGPGQGERDREKSQETEPDGTDRADLQVACRRPGDRGFLVLWPSRAIGQALLRGACRRGLPADEQPPRSQAVSDTYMTNDGGAFRGPFLFWPISRRV